MKHLPLLLLDSYKRPTRSTAFLVKVVALDGQVLASTTLDDRYEYDGVWYEPDIALNPQNIQSTTSVSEPDNTELHGWFDSVVQALMLAGKFTGGEITIYRVSYLLPTAGAEIVAYGTVGKVEYAADASMYRTVEWLGLDDKLLHSKNPLFSLTCRNGFGDSRCKMPFVWHAAEVIDVEDARMRFRIDTLSQPDGYFTLGLCLFVDGDNAQADPEIESWTSDGWITLAFPAPYNIEVGVNVKLRQDCDKTHAACMAYGNVINMNAEHLTPVQEQALMVPGAYIKSSYSV